MVLRYLLCNRQMKVVTYIAESPNRHCVESGLSNLVSLSGTPDVGTSYHEYPTSSKPLSRNQRCFRYRDCFDGGGAGDSAIRTASYSPQGCAVADPRTLSNDKSRATFKTVSVSSNLDRILKDNQGGCLYEWPVVSNCACVAGSRRWFFVKGDGYRNAGENPAARSIWQKSGIGVRPSDRSSSLMALPRGKDNRVLQGVFDDAKGSRIRPHPLSWMQASGIFKASCAQSYMLQAGIYLPRKGAKLW